MILSYSLTESLSLGLDIDRCHIYIIESQIRQHGEVLGEGKGHYCALNGVFLDPIA